MVSITTFLNIIFPKSCLSCNKWGRYFCSSCSSDLPITGTTICPACTKLSPFGLVHPGCKTRYSLDGLASGFKYKGPVQKAIKKIKYRRLQDISPELCHLLVSIVNNNSYPAFYKYLKSKPIIVPIPLHNARKRKRWFNQSEVLARDIASLLNLDVQSKVLKRIRRTHPQAGLTKDERAKNIKGAFEINPNTKAQISNSSVILIDDVWTTGATIREAGNVLKRNGVKSVWALTVAR